MCFVSVTFSVVGDVWEEVADEANVWGRWLVMEWFGWGQSIAAK